MPTTRREPDYFKLLQRHALDLALRDFLLDCQAANLSEGTRRYYRQKATAFIAFLKEQGVETAGEIQPGHVRAFLASLTHGHNSGGVHAFYRVCKTFCRFLQREHLLEGDPFQGVRVPRYDLPPLKPVDMDTFRALLATCDDAPTDRRDRAILLTLLDTGLRKSEIVALNVGDVNLDDGTILIRKSKSRKSRIAFIGRLTRRAIAAYLRTRGAPRDAAPLWLAYHPDGKQDRLGAAGLRSMIVRRARRAGVTPPSLHSFRRAFALSMYRGGANLEALRLLLGHSNFGVLTRYLRLELEDLRRVHESHSPVDRLNEEFRKDR